MTAAEYTISQDDYTSALRLHAAPTRKVYMLLGISLTGLLLLFFFSSVRVIADISLGAFIGGLITFFGITFVVNPLIGKHHYKKYKLIQQEFTLDFDEDALITTSSSGQSKIAWNNILKWRENDKYILLYSMPRLYYILPKRISEQGFELEKLTAKLREHIGDPVQ